MLTSVLIPTRGRAKMLIGAIQSIQSTATIGSDVEFLLKIDSDDSETKSAIEKFLAYNGDISIRWIESGRGNGYADLHYWYLQLAQISLGEWLLVWNDDARMLSPQWDELLRESSKVFCPEDKIAMFVPKMWDHHAPPSLFFLNKKYVDVLGNLSWIPHIDDWIHSIMTILSRVFYVPIGISHYWQTTDDRVKQDQWKSLATLDKNYAKHARQRMVDTEMLLQYIENFSKSKRF